MFSKSTKNTPLNIYNDIVGLIGSDFGLKESDYTGHGGYTFHGFESLDGSSIIIREGPENHYRFADGGENLENWNSRYCLDYEKISIPGVKQYKKTVNLDDEFRNNIIKAQQIGKQMGILPRKGETK